MPPRMETACERDQTHEFHSDREWYRIIFRRPGRETLLEYQTRKLRNRRDHRQTRPPDQTFSN